MAKTLFKKGKAANPNGRPKGARNKALKAFRELLAEKITIDDIMSDLAKCNARDRATLKIKLLEFAQPKLRSIEISDMPLISELIAMTPDERKARLLELMKKKNYG